MGIESQEPEPLKGRQIAKWDYQPIPNGGRFNGYLAGYPFGTWVHHDGTSRPCRRKITGGQMQCGYCGMGKAPEWRGYLPFYGPTFLNLFVLIPAEMREYVLTLGKHDQIVLTRGKSKRSPVEVEAKLWTVKRLPSNPARDQMADIRDWIIGHIWKDVEIMRYHVSAAVEIGEGRHAEGNESTVVEDFSLMNRAAARKAGFPNIAQRLAGSSPLDVSGIGGMPDDKPPANGRHKSNGKK